MAKIQKRVEFLIIDTIVSKGQEEIKFEELFEHNEIIKNEFHNGDKIHTFDKVVSNDDYYIGLMTTKLKRNIPPKLKKITILL